MNASVVQPGRTPAKKKSGAVVAAAITIAGLGQVYDMAAPEIRYWEGMRNTPYRDIVNVLTVCYGHTGKDIVPGKKYTAAECNMTLKRDMDVHFKYIQKCIRAPLPIPTLAALLVGTFNLGPGFVCGSKLQKHFNAGEIAQGCGQIMRWTRAGGQVVQGLVNRRKVEYKLCMLGMLEVYK